MDAIADTSSAFELPTELREFKATVRRFVDRELIPIERDSCVDDKLKPEIRTALAKKAKDIGLDQYDIPEKYGGLGLGLLAKVVVWEELGRTVALPARDDAIFGPSVSPILYTLNQEQTERFLLPTIRGEIRWCFAQTEPDAGSDPASMRTAAVLNGDHYVLNGTKRFITRADEADFAQVVAVTDKQKGSRGGMSMFIVDMTSPGVKLLRRQELGEYLGGNTGLGYLLIGRMNAFETDGLFAVMLQMTLLGFAFYFTVGMLRRVLIPWHQSANAAQEI